MDTGTTSVELVYPIRVELKYDESACHSAKGASIADWSHRKRERGQWSHLEHKNRSTRDVFYIEHLVDGPDAPLSQNKPPPITKPTR